MNILFLGGSNQYGVIDFFLDGIKADLVSMGHTCHSLSFAKDHQDATFETLKAGVEFDVLFSFNGIGLDVKNEAGNGLFESSGKPVFIFLVDHPIHLITRFLGTPATVLCVDEEHVSFCQLCGLKAHFFPHAISHSQISETQVAPGEKAQRVVFPVSYFDLAHWQEKLKPVWHQISPLLNQVNNITRFLQLIGVLPMAGKNATVPLDNNILTISRFVDFYFRARSRENALKDAHDLGVTLSVIGNRTANYQNRYPTHEYLEPLPFDELVSLINSSKFVLHNSPGFERGLHERLIIPMAHSTLPVTTSEPFGKHLFSPDVHIPALADISALSDQDYATGAAKNLESVKSMHTWQHRLTALFDAHGIA